MMVTIGRDLNTPWSMPLHKDLICGKFYLYKIYQSSRNADIYEAMLILVISLPVLILSSTEPSGLSTFMTFRSRLETNGCQMAQ